MALREPTPGIEQAPPIPLWLNHISRSVGHERRTATIDRRGQAGWHDDQPDDFRQALADSTDYDAQIHRVLNNVAVNVIRMLLQQRWSP